MSDALARVIATALEASTALNEERVRQIVREELAAFRPDIAVGWMTPPAAAKSRGIATKRVRTLMDSGAVQKRAKNPGSANPKFEINLASLDKALAGGGPQPQQAEPIDAQSWAAARASRKAGG